MLDLSTAVLCDFAQVRDRLLFVSSGAVSRLYRQELPSPLGLMVGLVIEVPLEDAGMEHRLRAEVINRHGTVLATLENLFRVSDAGLFPHEVQQVPLVLSITGVRARTWGTHQVRLYLDDDLVRALTLYVVPAAGPQAAVRATPTQSRVADDEGTIGGTGTDGADAPAEEEAPAAVAGPDEEDTSEDAPAVAVPIAADTASASAADEPAESEPAESRSTVSWGEPSEQGEPHELDPEPEPEIVLDLDPVLDLEIEPEPSWEPDPEPEPEPEPSALEREPEPDRPAWRTPTIDAAPAFDEDAPATQPVPQVFDFDEDDLDADPARGRPPEAKPAKEPSRFSFRYRYEEEDEES